MTLTAELATTLAAAAACRERVGTASVAGRPRFASTLSNVRTYIRRYVVVSADQATAIALWAAHTHVLDAADCTPYLQVTSATPRAGKTRLLEVLEPIVARPWLTGRTSAAALVRRIDADRSTLLLDESDAALGRDADREYSETLRGILCAGYRRSGRVTLCVGQGAKIEAREFGAYAAKAIAGIGELPPTIEDRSIRITLRRRISDEPVARWRQRDGALEAASLYAALAEWSAEPAMLAALRDARPAIPMALDDRGADVWEALLAIADLAGDDWPETSRRAAITLRRSAQANDTDPVTELLRDVADILRSDADAILPSSELLAKLVAREDRPWADWRHGRPLTARGLARLLAPLGCFPTMAHARRGYRRDALVDAVARYGSAHPPDVSVEPQPTRANSGFAADAGTSKASDSELQQSAKEHDPAADQRKNRGARSDDYEERLYGNA